VSIYPKQCNNTCNQTHWQLERSTDHNVLSQIFKEHERMNYKKAKKYVDLVVKHHIKEALMLLLQ
jgi:hypothetical protein